MSKLLCVTAEFSDEIKSSLTNWSLKNIPRESIVSAIIDGEEKGGDMTGKTHLTVFYGIDGEFANMEEIQNLCDNTEKPELVADDFSTFHLNKYNCNVLYIRIKRNEIIDEFNKKLSKLPAIKDMENENYIPHITVAYIKDDFDIGKLKIPDDLIKLKVKDYKCYIKYLIV